jgi:hypothetical protein
MSEPYKNARVGLEVSVDRLHSPRVTVALHYDDRSTNTKYTFYEWDTRHIPDLNLVLNKLQLMSSHVRSIIINIIRQLCALHREDMNLVRLTRSHIDACSLSQTVDKQLYDEIGKFYISDIAQTVRRIKRGRERVLEDTPK